MIYAIANAANAQPRCSGGKGFDNWRIFLIVRSSRGVKIPFTFFHVPDGRRQVAFIADRSGLQEGLGDDGNGVLLEEVRPDPITYLVD
jgi:hypothetical protein